MNIFYLSHDPQECAVWHNDSHCIKMLLEHCQILSTAHRILDGVMGYTTDATGMSRKRWVLPDEREQLLYKTTHQNHPSTVWARSSKSNYLWLVDMTEALFAEYTYRYGKVHATQRTGIFDALRTAPTNINTGVDFTQPTPAMPDDCKVAGDSISSYRHYINRYKRHLHHWKNRPTPPWITEQ